jgi:hypothetical protein
MDAVKILVKMQLVYERDQYLPNLNLAKINLYHIKLKKRTYSYGEALTIQV